MSFDKGGDAAALEAEANQKAIDEIKRQFDETKADVDPFIEAGTTALGRVEESATLAGFETSIDAIRDSTVLDPIREERLVDVAGADAARGLNRSGAGLENIADVSTDLIFQLEDLLNTRSGALADTGVNTALSLGSLGSTAATGKANLLSATGRAESAGSLLDDEILAGAVDQAAGAAATLLPLIFSDPDLKENVEEIGNVGPLKLYQWDWIPGAKNTLIAMCPKIGFMADEVKNVYPEFVHKFNSWFVVDYKGLLGELEENYGVILEGVE